MDARKAYCEEGECILYDILCTAKHLEVGADFGQHDCQHHQVILETQPFCQPHIHLHEKI